MDLNRSAIFAAVVDAGGFTAAGRKLGLPKATVSKKVSDLEAELGVRLLNRTTRHVSLTEAGARLHSHCILALGQMEQAQREVQALQTEAEGLLTIGAPSAIGTRFLLPIIDDLMARYSGLRVSLIAVNDDVNLVEDGIDVLIWPGVLSGAVHAVQLLTRVEIGLYAASDYLSAREQPKLPSDLEKHIAIAFTQALTNGRFAWRLTRGGTVVDVAPHTPPRFLSNDAVAIMAAVLGGQGIAALPVGYVNRSPEARALVRILPDWAERRIEMNAYYRDGSSSSRKTKLFLDFVSSWFHNNRV